MPPTRRDFLQRSAASATALALGPLGPLGHDAAALESLAAEPVAEIRTRERAVTRARAVPLDRVRVTGGPLQHAQRLTAEYLLALDPDRMLAPYRARAGLKPKGEPYAGWDGGGRNLTGHIAGHHLSAVSLMYRATGDARFRARADYLVRELKTVQDANGDGYLGALEGLREAFAKLSAGEIRSAAFDLNGLWSPWYTLHKTYAGLRDAHRHAGIRDALAVETRYAAWAERVLAPLSDAQMQRMLDTEHGGMNEVLADLYADTGDARWLALSRRFEHRAVAEPMKRHVDVLNGKHGNCNIPKFIGSAARYAYDGDPADIVAATFFWDRVVQHHSYATGGHGLAEYWGPPDVIAARVDGRACESCNDYNMLKLTRRLFAFRPDALYADFHERALFNHVLASIDPEDGRTSYMVPVGRGVQQEYQDMQRSFTCCVGTGMESHALHGDGIYYESPDTTWINLFVPSTVRLANGATLVQETSFPDGDSATLSLRMPAPKTFTLAIRRPSWAGDGFRVSVNGVVVEQPALATLRLGNGGGRDVNRDDRTLPPSSYVELRRAWKDGDRVELALPKAVRFEPTPDDRTVGAVMWGPLVLAADHGPRFETRGRVADDSADDPPTPTPVPALVAAGRPLGEWLVRAGDRPGDFVARGVGRVPGDAAVMDVHFAPFHRTHRRRYSVYVDVIDQPTFDARSTGVVAARERQRRLDAATLGIVRPGDATSERDRAYRSEPAQRAPGRSMGRTSRGGAGWFSYELPIDASGPVAVVVTYQNDLGLPPASGDFEILVDGTSVGRFVPDTEARGFFDVRYDVPAAVATGKSAVTVRFQSAPNGRIAPVFGVRTVRVSQL